MQKKSYTTPQLKDYGQVKKLTLSNNYYGKYCDKYGRRTNHSYFKCSSGGGS